MRLDHLLSRERESVLSVRRRRLHPPRLIVMIVPLPRWVGGGARIRPGEVIDDPATEPIPFAQDYLSLFKC